MSFDAKRLQSLLIRSVAEEVTKHGFSSKPVGQEFRKKIPGGRVALHLSFIKHAADVDVTADIGVRFDALEEQVTRGDTFLSEREKKDTYSLGAELGNIHEGRPKRWRIADESDVARVAKGIVDYFVSVGLPHLERLSDMGHALNLLSREDAAARLFSPFDAERAKRAMVLAFLLGPRERFRQVADAKTESLSARNDSGLESFMRLREELEK